MPFAAALSEHPVTAYATGEVCGRVLEAIGTHPDLVLVFTTLAHAGALEDVVATIGEVLQPTVIVGAASESVVGTAQEVEGGPAVSVWAGRWGPVLPVRLAPRSTLAIPDELPFAPSALLLVGDPYSVPVDDVLASVSPALPVAGGMASGARGPGGSRLALGGSVFTDGAVGALLGPGADVLPVVSQGCRPIGRPLVITDGGGQIIRELGGRPAMERIDELAKSLSPEEIHAVNVGGLHIGRVIDERKVDFATGDFLVRAVLGADKETGAIVVNDPVEIGTVVQFHLRDADAAHADLDRLLQAAAPTDPEAALLFTCNGRGERLFGTPDHDAGLVADRLGDIPTAGFFAAGELGPIGGRNELHSFTASILLLREHR
ncbi:MAG: FIST signal transduction protein [Acidimicrobiales bacterium]